MMQLKLFKVEGSKTINYKEIQQQKVKAKKDELQKCLEYLKTSSCLWDMRAWRLYKDKTEVEEYVKNPDFKNDGHAQYCIEELNQAGIPRKTIIKAIMENKNISYKHRVVPCMLLPEDKRCPKWQGDYSKTDCEGCH